MWQIQMESFKSLITDLGQHLYLSDFCADDQGYIAINFGTQVVHLQYDDQLDEVVVFARAGKIQPERMQETCTALLAANLFWQGTQGATFSVEPGTGIIFLADRKALVVLNAAILSDWLEHFLKIADYWRERLKLGQFDFDQAK